MIDDIVSDIDMNTFTPSKFAFRKEYAFSVHFDDQKIKALMRNGMTYEAAWEATDWYGVKQVDLGFDSEDIILAADYYGGSFARIMQIYGGEETDMIRSELLDMLSEVMADEGIVTADTPVLYEIR